MSTSPGDAPPAAGPYLQTCALASQCRFGGHSRVSYSVAQHSVIVSRVAEERGGDVVEIKANVPEIKAADRALLATERGAFSAEIWHWPELEGVEPLDLELTPWPPDRAAAEFAKRYAELEARR